MAVALSPLSIPESATLLESESVLLLDPDSGSAPLGDPESSPLAAPPLDDDMASFVSAWLFSFPFLPLELEQPAQMLALNARISSRRSIPFNAAPPSEPRVLRSDNHARAFRADT
jgi:hypothetical protein